MTQPVEISFVSPEDAPMAAAEGAVAVFTLKDKALSAGAEEADRLTTGAVSRVVAAKAFSGKAGAVAVINAPHGMAAEKLLVVALGDAPSAGDARKTGAAVAKRVGDGAVAYYGAGAPEIQAEVAFGHALRADIRVLVGVGEVLGLVPLDALIHRPEHTGDAALLAQQPHPQLLQRCGIGRLGDLRRGLLLEGIELIGELLQGDRCAHRDGTDSCRL